MLALLPRLVEAGVPSVSIRVAPIAVECGFPSPAQDYYDGPIDLTEMLVHDRAATFIVRASGRSMTGAGINDGDELLVDRSIDPRDGDVIVAVLDGELVVKRLEVTTGGVILRAENRSHPDVVVAELSDLRVWGVVTYCLHHLRR